MKDLYDHIQIVTFMVRWAYEDGSADEEAWALAAYNALRMSNRACAHLALAAHEMAEAEAAYVREYNADERLQFVRFYLLLSQVLTDACS